MANPRVLSEIKKVRGTYRRDHAAENEPTGTMGTPEPPAYLSEMATNIFYQTAARLERFCILRIEWADQWAAYALAMEEVESCTSTHQEIGASYTRTTQQGDTMHRPYPNVAQRAEARNRALKARSEMSLTPVAKGRLRQRTYRRGTLFC